MERENLVNSVCFGEKKVEMSWITATCKSKLNTVSLLGERKNLNPFFLKADLISIEISLYQSLHNAKGVVSHFMRSINASLVFALKALHTP